MADIVKTTSTLNMQLQFTDGDDRTLAVDNPDTSKNLVSLVNDLSSFIKTNQIVKGDKAGATFSKIGSAKILNKTVTVLDLTL